MVEENESTRGMTWEARICWPVRMCHPMPASPSSRTDNDVQVRTASRAMKMVSAVDGISRRVQTGCALAAGAPSGELLEPSAIAVNLIECGFEQQDRGLCERRGKAACSNRGRRFRRPQRRENPGAREGADHSH